MDPLLQVFVLVFVASLVTMVLLKLQKRIMPKRYFHFARLIDGLDEDVPYAGVAFRTSVPLIAGLASGLALILLQLPARPNVVGAAVGFMTAFWLVWPDFYNPELISPFYSNKKSKLYLLYVLVLIVFTIMGLLGGLLSPYLFRSFNPAAVAGYIDPKTIFNNGLSVILFNSFLWLGLSRLIKSQLRRVGIAADTSDHNGTANRDADAG